MNSEPRANILIIEDDAGAAAGMRRLLEVEGYAVEAVGTADEGITRARTSNFDIVVSDLEMPGKSGLEVISELRPIKPHLPIILVTGKHTDDAAIEAIRRGAYDYMLKNTEPQPKPVDFQEKPIDPKEFLERIQKALLSRAASQQAPGPRPTSALPSAGEPPGGESIVGRSRAMQRVFKLIGRVAAKPVTVLIRGETGTGKELVARAIFQHSQRAQQPFIIVNCVAIPDTLLESELFGHEAGAFTGAQTRRVGKFEQADKGTIFLDEIGDMNLTTQAKLLRVLQERTIQRLGSQQPISIDVRVLAATHRELETAVEEKKFRADLYYRLNDAVIQLPSLRERREDIAALVRYFLSRQPESPVAPKSTITPEAVRFLQYRAWPGNVRELRNVVHKAWLMAHGYPIDLEIIRRAVAQASLPSPEAQAYLQAYVTELLERAEAGPTIPAQAALTEWAERELYEQAIGLAAGDQTKVAKWLGVSRPTVRERLLHFGLHPGRSESQTAPEKIQG
jgi:DNA-binding NtrC family response regulator